MAYLSKFIIAQKGNADNVRDTIQEIIVMLSGETYLDVNNIRIKAETITTLSNEEIDVLVRMEQLCRYFTRLLNLEQQRREYRSQSDEMEKHA